MRFITFLFAWSAFLLSHVPVQAQLPNMEIHVHAGLETETSRPKAGSTVTLAITMRPDAGWHGYWINPGDAGEGLALDWQLPAGSKVGEPRFPMPETLMISGFMNYVYEKPHAILVDITLPQELAVGTKLPVMADANWLACTDRVCVPQQGRLSLELIVGDGRIDSSSKAKFDLWRAALPVPLDRKARYAVSGKRIEIAIPYPAGATVEQPYFFPLTSAAIDYASPQKTRRAGDWLVVETGVAQTSEQPLTGTISGVLRYREDKGLAVEAETGLIPTGGTDLPQSNSSKLALPQTPPLFMLLFGALAGGILLNIMPCVFPILGLKALALAKAGGSEAAARADALAYAAGVILSCVALGGLMLLLRAGGEQVGWAFQLQEPRFVLLLLLVMVAVTANLAGLFELRGFDVGQTLTRSPGLFGSFWTGVLAALVATPCTGPFMAAALGAALLLPVVAAMALFFALGLGIALPFLVIAYIPALRNRLPKAGPWLNTFKKLMAVPMGLTALALLWLLLRLTGSVGLTTGVIAALALLGIFAFFRCRQSAVYNLGTGQILLSTAFVFAALWWLPDASDRSSNVNGAESILGAQPFSETRLSQLRAKGRPVFVYFTADWCVTCKVNEATVLERPKTAALFEKRGIVVLRGDFTRQDPEIARFLFAQRAAGVPLYLFYPKGREALQLPQILSAKQLNAMTGY